MGTHRKTHVMVEEKTCVVSPMNDEHLLAGFSSLHRYGTVCSGELLSSQMQNCCKKERNKESI